MSSNNKIVSCKNLKKTYQGDENPVFALRGLDLELNKNELLMLVGPSGCGKTTLLSIISGILSQDSGSCKIFGTEINELHNDKKTAFRKKNIGFVFQAFNLLPMLSAQENASIPLVLQGLELDQAQDLARTLLNTVGLKGRENAYPPHLSGGEQQRVAICRACIHKPGLIICDEPTSALDHKTGLKMVEILQHLAKTQDCSIIIVTHDTRILPYADRILEMDDGKVIQSSLQSNS